MGVFRDNVDPNQEDLGWGALSFKKSSAAAEVLDLLVRALHFVFPGGALLSRFAPGAGGLWDPWFRVSGLGLSLGFRFRV